jgi:TolB-like protein
MSFFDELKRRNVFRVGIAYAVSAWVLLQVVDLVLENIAAPEWVMQVFMLALAVGLPVALIFAWAFEITPEGVKLEKHVDRSKSIARETGQKMNRHIIIALSIAVAFLLVDRFIPGKGTDPQPAVEKAGNTGVLVAEAETTEKSIAVLPFVNMSSDPEQDYFADGISEEILNALAGVSELKVAGRTSSFAFKGKNEDLLAIGKVLRVEHILEGSVRKSGNRVRITAQLIKVDDGFHMWSETFDREIDDIFVIQDEISAAILVQLKTQLLGDQQLVTATTDTRAYELYLLAKQRIYERTQPSLEMGVKLLDEAIGIDAGYAPAFAQLGIANLLLSDQNYGTLPHTSAGENAKRSLDTALQLDPRNAEALAGMGLYLTNHELDHENAMNVLQQAVAINPNMVNANTWLATEMDNAGELRAGMQLREKTFKRDPLHGPTFGNLQQSYTVMGQTEKALEMLDSLQAYLPGDANLLGDYGKVNLMTGHLAESQRYFQQSYDKEPLNTNNRLWFGFTLLKSRQYDLMAEITPDNLATLALSRLGRTEEALILGTKSIGSGQYPGWYFQTLVENGRFAELINVLESRWPSLEDFSTNWSGGNGYGYDAMGFIAEAYRNVGNETKFNNAMLRFRTSLDAQLAEGAENWPMSFSQAYFAVLANDNAAAITFLEEAFQQGGYLDTENETAWPIFKVLDGDPRYEAAKAAMVARFNSELEKMNLEDLPIGEGS